MGHHGGGKREQVAKRRDENARSRDMGVQHHNHIHKVSKVESDVFICKQCNLLRNSLHLLQAEEYVRSRRLFDTFDSKIVDSWLSEGLQVDSDTGKVGREKATTL